MSVGMDADAVIFDMDGMLVQSEVHWFEEIEQILSTTLPKDTDVAVADEIVDGSRELCERIETIVFGRPGSTHGVEEG